MASSQDLTFSSTRITPLFTIFVILFQLQSMLKKNETLPEIEQLNRHEFDLDIEEQLKLQAEADLEVERVGLSSEL